MTDAPLFSDPALHEAGAIRFREERTAGDVLATAIRLALSEARAFFSALFAIVGPMVVAGALVRLAAGPSGELIGSLVDAAANLLATSTALGFARLYMRGGPLGVADVWDEARGLLGPLLLFALVLVGLGIALMIPVVVLASAVGIGGGGAAMVGVAVLVVAAILVLTPVVSLGLVAVGLDALRPLAALARARALVRPHLGLVVLTLVLVAAVSIFALMAIGGLFGALFAAGVADPSSPEPQAIPAAVGTLLVLPISAVMTLVWVLLYGSLVEAEEGTSLGGDLDDLANVLSDRPPARPAPRETSHVHPEDVARPLGRERPSGSLDVLLREDATDDAPGVDAPSEDAPDGGPPAPDATRGFRGGGFSGGAS